MGDVLNKSAQEWVVAIIISTLVWILIGVALLVHQAYAAPLTATARHLGGSVVSVTVHLDVTVKHPQRAVVWTYGCKGWTNGHACFGRELYWPVRLHAGRNRIRVGVLAVAYEQTPSFGTQGLRMTGDTSAVFVGVRRHSARAPDWIGPRSLSSPADSQEQG